MPESAGRGRTIGASSVDPAVALRTAIEDGYADLHKYVEVLVLRARLADRREAIVAIADEVLQLSVVRALSHAESYDPSRPARSWLAGVARHTLQDYQRTLYRERNRPTTLENLSDSEPPVSDVEMSQAYEVLEAGESLDQLLAMVSGADRQVLRLRFVEGVEGRDLARTLGVSEGAARVRLSRALARAGACISRLRQRDREET